MSSSFYFYDLETSGFDPKKHRIMQFAGQRTDMDLKPIGEPHNYFIKMTTDTLPDPGAVLVTGITPQATIKDGITEHEFLQIFYKEIAAPEVIFIGFNSVRFDDEFMRYLNYRNFYDPYEWHWADGRSRWDLLDLTRMTRALRPDGIEWPVGKDGQSTNRLELLASINKLEHAKAHDALSDVTVSIEWAKLLKEKQPKLFSHLLEIRDKRSVAELVDGGQPFVYSSGKYASATEKTTAVAKLLSRADGSSAVVFDLRYDPETINNLSLSELIEMWTHRCFEYPCPHPRVPLKTIKYNRCPAVAPLGVLDEASQKRLQLPMDTVLQNYKKLAGIHKEFAGKITEALKELDKKQSSLAIEIDADVNAQMYDEFINKKDQANMAEVREADEKSLKQVKPNFSDKRLNSLLPLYKARNFPKSLNDEEMGIWDEFCKRRLVGGGQNSWAAKYFNAIEEMANSPGLSKNDGYLLEELQLWGQSILPVDE
jgi:exodeoxyribonuclease-1